MRITTLTTLAVLALGGTAMAGAPVPVPQSAVDRPVSTDIDIVDGGGATVQSLSCSWSTGGPGADDRQCLRFQSDPQVAFGAIQEAGGERARQHTVTDVSDMRIDWTRRADGTWLIRSIGEIDGAPRHFGRVCTADGQHCRMWDAGGARTARKAVRAAAANLHRSHR